MFGSVDWAVEQLRLEPYSGDSIGAASVLVCFQSHGCQNFFLSHLNGTCTTRNFYRSTLELLLYTTLRPL